jgi:predicted alpha/beta superfamily hydrolase
MSEEQKSTDQITTRNAATIHTSDVLNVRSKNTNQEYRISVSLPASYDYEPEKIYPIV